MPRAVAIAVIQDNPFVLALRSAHNLMTLLADYMYGSEKRTKTTGVVAFALIMLGSLLHSASVQALQVCPLS